MMDWMSFVVGVGAGILVLVPVILRVTSHRNRVAQELASIQGQLSQAQQSFQDLRLSFNSATGNLLEAEKRCSALEAELHQSRLHAQDKLAQVMNVKEEMTQHFRVLAEDVMKRHGETITQVSKEQMDSLLIPLRHKLTDFQQELQKSHTESAKERASLTEQIRSLSESSGRMTQETVNLTRALKGDSKAQGMWGEIILDTILAKSGLREGHEYVTQDSHTTEDGRRQILDVKINLPDGQAIIVDSKVSLKDFEVSINAETDVLREAHLLAHCRSLRSHIKLLSEKAYQKHTDGGLDFVLMFVPSEGALAAALSHDLELISFATDKNVTIVTPTTLMIALKTVANVWNVENRNRNAEQIAERAGQMYDKFVAFVEDLLRLDSQMKTAQDTLGKAFTKLNGKGGLVSRTKLIKDMGAKTTKLLPSSLLEEDEEQ